jgi:hypothetical protein
MSESKTSSDLMDHDHNHELKISDAQDFRKWTDKCFMNRQLQGHPQCYVDVNLPDAFIPLNKHMKNATKQPMFTTNTPYNSPALQAIATTNCTKQQVKSINIY